MNKFQNQMDEIIMKNKEQELIKSAKSIISKHMSTFHTNEDSKIFVCLAEAFLDFHINQKPSINMKTLLKVLSSNEMQAYKYNDWYREDCLRCLEEADAIDDLLDHLDLPQYLKFYEENEILP